MFHPPARDEKAKDKANDIKNPVFEDEYLKLLEFAAVFQEQSLVKAENEATRADKISRLQQNLRFYQPDQINTFPSD